MSVTCLVENRELVLRLARELERAIMMERPTVRVASSDTIDAIGSHRYLSVVTELVVRDGSSREVGVRLMHQALVVVGRVTCW